MKIIMIKYLKMLLNLLTLTEPNAYIIKNKIIIYTIYILFNLLK